ncbi:MAG: 50S ribosomal protein L15 [Myxococcales bacterium]|nr:50S ribosomal protein L15 [Myxococcales bacterium]
MNELSNLKPPKGSRKARKRVGRGPGSGTGKTAGRGQKGQKARAASKKKPGFEGGQMPLQRRLPKRGFTPINRNDYAIVNVAALNAFEAGTEVTPELLASSGMIRKASDKVKILGNGDLTVSVSLKAHKISQSAADKVNAAGGSFEVIGG